MVMARNLNLNRVWLSACHPPEKLSNGCRYTLAREGPKAGVSSEVKLYNGLA